VYRNDGPSQWPADTTFIQTSGDDVKFMMPAMSVIVKPEQEFTWTAYFTAPQKPGRY